MNVLKTVMKPVLIGALLALLGAGLAMSAELDDSTLFVDAFNASQKKDYLLAIEKLNLLDQAFAETPLRDVSLLLLARSAYKSGDNELAARSVNRFLAEFPDSKLKNSVERELVSAGERLAKGEKVLPNKQLQVAARKVRSERIAQERSLALRLEQERLAREKAEQERIAMEKAAAERKERERKEREQAEKQSIKLAFSVPSALYTVASGTAGRIAFDVVNKGKEEGEFIISTGIPPEYAPQLASADAPDKVLDRFVLGAGQSHGVVLTYKLPEEMVDGYRLALPLKVVSAKYADVGFTRELAVIATAPLVRTVVKPSVAKAARGDVVAYRVSVLNAGTLAARNLAVRITVPPQLEVVEPGGDLVFNVGELESGSLKEFSFKAKIKQVGQGKEELRCRIELSSETQKVKEVSQSSMLVIGSQ